MKEIYEKYNEFVVAENQTEKEIIRIEIKNKILSNKKISSEGYQILGLIDYESKDWKKKSEDIIENFTKAIKKDKANFLSQLYLAHIHHDLGYLEIALENYLKVDKKALKNFQIWRHTKLIEQIGYCKYKLGNKKEGLILFKEVLELYKKLPEIDRVVPLELIECLPENHEIIVEIKKIEPYF